MRNYSRYMLIIPLLILCIGSCRQENVVETPPNVIFFIADDMTRDMFNFLEEGKGKNLSPNIDRLASEGTIMMGQHVASPVCTPTRFNCLTGRFASRAQSGDFLEKMKDSGNQTVVEWNTFITENDTTVAHYLRDAGYATGFVGKNHVIEVPGLFIPDNFHGDPEDSLLRDRLAANADKFHAPFRAAGFDYAEHIYDNNPIYIGLEKLAVHNLDWITEAGLDFIEQHKEEPFFLYFASTTPHGPYEIDRAWGADRRITPYGILEDPVELLSDKETIIHRLENANIDLTSGNLGTRGNVLWLDDALGALIDKLKEVGVYENTIIFFFNDHGQFAKGTVYQGGTENPSIVWKHGGFKAGNRSEALVSNVDFAPTILDLACIEHHNDGFDGRSFAPILDGASSDIHSSLYFEMGYSRGVRKGDMKYIALRYPEFARNMTEDERMERLQRFNARQKLHGKRIHHTDPSMPFSHLQLIPGGGDAEQGSISRYSCYYDSDQLYDLSADPKEQVNLAEYSAYNDTLKEMQMVLQSYLKELPGAFGDLKKSGRLIAGNE